MSAPVVLFVYNRPEHTRATLQALSMNVGISDAQIHVFADGPAPNAPIELLEEIKKVRDFIRKNEYSLNLEMHFSKENKGLANSIISGVGKVISEFGKVIVLEDDLVCSKYFLNYMNSCLDKYQEEPKIMHIGGYSPSIKFDVKEDVYFLSFASSWGWATWEDRWSKFRMDSKGIIEELDRRKLKSRFDFYDSYPFYDMVKQQIEGDIDSWAIRWNATVFLNDGLGIYPVKSLVRNIGFDGSGVHSGTGSWYDVKVSKNFKPNLKKYITVDDDKIRMQYGRFYKEHNNYTIWQRIKDKIKYEIKNAKGSSH